MMNKQEKTPKFFPLISPLLKKLENEKQYISSYEN